MRGLEFSVNFEAYLRGREDCYGTNMPEIHRISRDIDPKTGLFWIPPSLADNYASVPESYRDYYRRGSTQIYHLLMEKMNQSIKTQLKMTHKVGLDLKTEIKCLENDGVTAYYLIMQLYHKQDDSMRKRLERYFEEAHTYFASGDPLRKVTFLQDKLLDIQKYGIKLKWDKTGEPIVVTLERMDHAWQQKLSEYAKDKITNKDDCAGHLDSLLADIVKGKKEIDRADRIVGSTSNRPKAKALSTRGNGKGKGKDGKGKGKGGKGKGGKGKDKQHYNRKCHFGKHCTRQNCPFEHPKNHTKCQEKDCNKDTKDGHRFCEECNNRGYVDGFLCIKPDGAKVHFKGAWKAHSQKRDRDEDMFGLDKLTSDRQSDFKRAFKAAVDRKVEAQLSETLDSPASPIGQAGPKGIQALSAQMAQLQQSINSQNNSTQTSKFDTFLNTQ